MEVERAAAEAAHWSAAQYHSALANASAKRVFLLSERESEVEAFLLARQVGPEWELENLAVSVPRRRHGVARALLESLINSAHEQGAEAIFLEVRASNSAARAFYEKCGFIHNGNRPRYYQKPVDDAALYRLSFV